MYKSTLVLNAALSVWQMEFIGLLVLGGFVGEFVGELVGFDEGLAMGESVDEDGLAVGESVGFDEGLAVGETVGFDKGLAVGESVGFDKGLAVGESVGFDEELAVGESQVVTAHQFSPPLVDSGEALYVQPEEVKMSTALV
jgi:hypothetical protein